MAEPRLMVFLGAALAADESPEFASGSEVAGEEAAGAETADEAAGFFSFIM